MTGIPHIHSWSGLTNPNNVVCYEASCNNKLFWEDEQPFVEAIPVDVNGVAESGEPLGGIINVGTSYFMVDDREKSHFACQYECS